VIHESLLSSWPRLVGWRTQDADAARLRDEVRHAARQWDEHERTDDYLWSGRAYREFALWQESYPGGLTEIEDAFASAMTSLATRRRRRRRVAAVAALIVFASVAAIFAGLWRRSVLETRRAEAQKLLALGQVELESFPTAALAWARASLGLADTREGRFLALKALANGPVARVLWFDNESEGQAHEALFSPNGEWAAFRGFNRLKVRHRERGPTRIIDTLPSLGFTNFHPFFDATGTRLGVWRPNRETGMVEIRTYEVPGFARTGFVEEPIRKGSTLAKTKRGFFRFDRNEGRVEIWRCPFDGQWGYVESIDDCSGRPYVDPRGEWMVCRRGHDLFMH
jgi:hypothetical protein